MHATEISEKGRLKVNCEHNCVLLYFTSSFVSIPTKSIFISFGMVFIDVATVSGYVLGKSILIENDKINI